MQINGKLNRLWVGPAIVTAALCAPMAVQAAASGTIGIYSEYVLRGMAENAENDGTTIQASLDWSHESGWYAGVWGSNLDYGNTDVNTGFETDLYGGYSGASGDFSYTIGLIQYAYIDVDDSDGTEFLANVGYGDFWAQMQYLIGDVAWGNGGDIYWTFGWGTDIGSGFSFDAILGYYTYDDTDSDNDDFGNPPDESVTTSTGEFRHLSLNLSHPIGDTGADMSISAIIGGRDRSEQTTGDALVLGVTYGFDI